MSDFRMLLRRQWPSLLLGAVLGAIVAIGIVVTETRDYTSQASVLVTSTNVEPTPASAARRPTDVNLDTEAQLVTSTETLTGAAKALGLGPAELANQVAVTVPPNSEILDISYTASSAVDAQKGAQAVATAYLDARKQSAEQTLQSAGASLQQRIDALTDEATKVADAGAALSPSSTARVLNDQQLSLLGTQLSALNDELDQVQSTTVTPGRIVSDAELPPGPSNRDPKLTVAAGAVLGLLLGVGLAVVRQRRDDTLWIPEDVAIRTTVPVVASLPRSASSPRRAKLPPESGRAVVRLRDRLVTELSRRSGRPVVLVAGVRRGGARVAADLADSWARTGQNVGLVCTDTGASAAADLLGRQPVKGMVEVLTDAADLEHCWETPWDLPNLRVLGAGSDPASLNALLQTAHARALVDQVLEWADYVVLDAPPTAENTTAQKLAPVATLALLTIECGGRTTARDVEDARLQLEAVGLPVYGAVTEQYSRRRSRQGRHGPGSPAPTFPSQVGEQEDPRPPGSDDGNDTPSRSGAAPVTERVPRS